MDEKNELNDIILNKNNSSIGNKKIILAVATLGVILIVVVMLMNTLTSKGTDNLPQAVLPPEPQQQAKSAMEEPLFEDVKVVQESDRENASLDAITQKLKEESLKENEQPQVVSEVKTKDKVKDESKASVAANVETKTPPAAPKESSSNAYYIQVGSFEKYEPNKKFLDSISRLGYKYKFHQVKINSKIINKVLVGPFYNEAEARKALISVRTSVEAGAFLTKI